MHLIIFLLFLLPLLNGEKHEPELSHLFDTLNTEEIRIEGHYIPTISENSFSQFDNTLRLNLQNNKIKTVENHAFRHLPTLRNIDLSSNQIQSLPNGIFNDTPFLTNLVMAKNNLTTLQKKLFTNLNYLLAIDFQFNKLSTIERECFVNVSSLEVINLENNNLKTLQFNIKNDFNQLHSLYLGGNPWDCSAELCEFMITVVNKFWNMKIDPICHSPNGTKGLTWKEVIDFHIPAIDINLANYALRTDRTILKCHVCTQTSITWTFENKTDVTNKAIQTSKELLTLSVLRITPFLDSNIGNYTCNCPKCQATSTAYVYIKVEPASDLMRIIVWSFIILILLSVGIYIKFFYSKNKQKEHNRFG